MAQQPPGSGGGRTQRRHQRNDIVRFECNAVVVETSETVCLCHCGPIHLAPPAVTCQPSRCCRARGIFDIASINSPNCYTRAAPRLPKRRLEECRGCWPAFQINGTLGQSLVY